MLFVSMKRVLPQLKHVQNPKRIGNSHVERRGYSLHEVLVRQPRALSTFTCFTSSFSGRVSAAGSASNLLLFFLVELVQDTLHTLLIGNELVRVHPEDISCLGRYR